MLGASYPIAKLTDLFFGEIDLPWLPFGQLTACQQSTCEIFEHRLRGYSKLRCCALNREATVGPAHRILVHAVDFDGGNAPAGAQHPHVLAFERAASGRDEAFLIENCCDL